MFPLFTVHIQNSAGETPMDVANRFAQLACVKLLKGDDSGKVMIYAKIFV